MISSLLGVLFALLPPADPVGDSGALCSIESHQPFRDGRGVALAVASAERRWISTPSRERLTPPGEEPPPLPDSVWGQVFEVVDTDSLVPAGEVGERVLVVPWEHDEACRDVAWTSDEWITPGDTVVFALHRRDLDPRHPLTYHVGGWYWPYPAGQFIRYQFLRRPEGPWIPASRYFDLLRALPDERTFREDPATGLEELRAWAGRRGLTDSFPVNAILRRWERAASGRRRPALRSKHRG